MELVVGAILEGKVTGITKFGAFVALPGGKSGLVHISNISNSYVNDINDFLSVGQEVKVKVDEHRQSNRINLSIQIMPSPPEQAPPRTCGGRPAGPRERNGHRNGGNAHRPRGGSSGGARSAPREPQTFEDKLKQYMAESESKLSSLSRYNDRGRSRRRRGN